MKPKAFGYILRDHDQHKQLLAMQVPGTEGMRLPGGGIQRKESIEAGVLREIREESGLAAVQIIRKLGVHVYYKGTSGTLFERHGYLLAVLVDTPDEWDHVVTGKGEDSGTTFSYRWLNADEIDLITPEMRRFVTPLYIPELFA